jgi:putative transposase
MTAALPPEAAGKPVEIWFTDEARVGQQGTITRVWAKRGSRPRAARDRRYEWAYLFGAICPERSTGAAIIMPEVNIEAMDEHLAEISRRVSVGAIALLVLDGAGWHSSPQLKVPDNIVLLPLPPYAPELNPVENVWEFLRANFLSHRVWDTYEAILDACQNAWNKLMEMPDRIASLTRRPWAKPVNRIGRLVFIPTARIVDSNVNRRGSTRCDSPSGLDGGDGDDRSNHTFGLVGG